MLRHYHRFFPCLLLLLWSMAAHAYPNINEDAFDLSERSWLSSHQELIIGMPMMGDPPYSYKDADQRFNGPVPDIAQQLARRLGLTLRYKVYPSYAHALSGLQNNEIDLLINYQPGAQWQPSIVSIPFLFAIPRGVLLNNGKTVLSPQDASKMKWVCVTGGGSCDEVKKWTSQRVVEVDSRNEAVFILKQRLADGFLAAMPSLFMLQELYPNTGFTVATPEWIKADSLSINLNHDNPTLVSLITKAFNEIPVEERRHMLEATTALSKSQSGDARPIEFSAEERRWLKQHPELTYGISPNWTSISEFNYRGQLVGFVADLMNLMHQYSGLNFSLVHTDNWSETQNLLKLRQIDFIPTISPTTERTKYSLFTPSYLFVERVVIGPKRSTDIPDLSHLKGKRVGMVLGSTDKALLEKIGAHPIGVDDDYCLLELLDNGEADYIFLTMPSMNRKISERYQIVYSGSDLRLPIAMAVQPDPMLQRILTKVLYSIPPDEFDKLEKRWLSMSVQTGLKSETVLLWFTIGGTAATIIFMLFGAWNRKLQREIVQRKIAENKLNEQLAFVRTLIDSLPNMVALRDRQQNLTLCNQAYRQVFIGAESGGDGWSYMPSDEREKMFREERLVWETGHMLEGSGYTHRHDEAPLHVIYVKLPYRAPDGEIQGILTVLTDVSALKAAEHKMLVAEARLRDITDSMPGMVYQYWWQAPGKGKFLHISQGAKDILGVSPQALLESTSGSSPFGLADGERQDFINQIANHARTLTPVDVEVKIPTPDGQRYLQVRGNFAKHANDMLLLNGVVQDITALKQQEHELREARAAAEQAMQARSRFLATMSHELRTPISGMHGMLELLRMSSLDDDQRYLLRNVESSANTLLYLVNDVLDFSKIEAGQLQLHYQTCRLQSAICDVIRGHATLAYGKGLKVAIHWDDTVPDQADIDVLRVGQVLSNLLNNAVKFTEQGSISIRIGYDRQQLAVSVADTGIGIAKMKQARLFTPFEQLESDINRRFGGTGLGLAICNQLLNKMGGTLTVQSQAGEGSCFAFTIPLVNCQWDPPALAGSQWWFFGKDPALQAIMSQLGATLTPLEPGQITATLSGLLLAEESALEAALGKEWFSVLQASALKGVVLSHREALRGRMDTRHWWRLGQSPLYPDLLLESCHDLVANGSTPTQETTTRKLSGRVLVVDDHAVNQTLLVRQLGILGIECQVVDNGEKALQAWQEQHFSLLLTDCHMPVMDGYTLTRHLRAQGEQTPIIGVTADTSEEASARMKAVGMNGMLFKPYSLESLRQILAQWLPVTDQPEAHPTAEQPNTVMLAKRWQELFGDEQIARDMAGKYLTSNQQDCHDMVAYLSTNNMKGLVEVAHRIKGAARMVGELTLADQVARLESAARLKQLDSLAALGQGVIDLMHDIEREMGLWLDE
ncbi:ATP-binding protein [Aeromonas sp. MdU4]|uniref:ATP-binding protein n=1 Tax=Aeromonas sp. MdU4 TaxID=3342819 RepID=UPI0035B84D00